MDIIFQFYNIKHRFCVHFLLLNGCYRISHSGRTFPCRCEYGILGMGRLKSVISSLRLNLYRKKAPFARELMQIRQNDARHRIYQEVRPADSEGGPSSRLEDGGKALHIGIGVAKHSLVAAGMDGEEAVVESARDERPNEVAADRCRDCRVLILWCHSTFRRPTASRSLSLILSRQMRSRDSTPFVLPRLAALTSRSSLTTSTKSASSLPSS